MSSSRDTILKTLLKKPRSTINELSEVVGINPISIRHHIIKLEAQDLVKSEEERHGVGRPHRVYYLTPEGMERFPTRYLNLTTRLLEKMKEELPEEVVGKLFADMGESLALDFSTNEKMNDLPMEERLEILKGLLMKEGFNVEWQLVDDQYHIKELNCPYYHIGLSHPEVCSVDQTLISTVLAVDAKKIKCILDGDTHCTYVVPKIPDAEIVILN